MNTPQVSHCRFKVVNQWVLLSLYLLLCRELSAQNGWSGSGLTVYKNNPPTTLINQSNAPHDRYYYYEITNHSPSSPCQDGSGNPYHHATTAKIHLSKGGSYTTATVLDVSVLNKFGCGSYSSSIDGVNSFLMPSTIAPGPRTLFRRYTGSPASVSNQIPLVVTVPNVIDLGVTQFDLVSETSVCTNSQVTVKFKVKNYGEIESTHLGAAIWMSDIPNATQVGDYEQIDGRLLGSIAGGDMGKFYEYTVLLPPTSGTKYFRAQVMDLETADGANWAFNLSEWDKVKLYPDMDFVGDGLIWVSPAASPALLCYGETMKVKFKYRNRGQVPSLPTTRVNIELKSGSADWRPIATIPVGAVPCHSETLFSEEYSIKFEDLAALDPQNYGKKWKLRLNFSSAGEQVETQTNNKSKGKFIKIVPVPDPALAARQLGAWIPEGRTGSSQPGAPGNTVMIEGKDESIGPPRRLRFELGEVSRHPGVCMNFGAPVDADEYNGLDLRFVKSATVNADFDAPGPNPEDQNGMWITTTGKVKSKSVVVTSYDYGSFGRLRVVALDDSGQAIGEPSPWLVIPQDSNQSPGNSTEAFGNFIADAWVNDLGTTNDSLDDSETSGGLTSDEPTKGDGLSKFEEYRGFMIAANVHRRFFPQARDVAVVRQNQNVYGYGDFNKLVAVHEMSADQMNGIVDEPGGGQSIGTINPLVGRRVINFNYSPDFHLVDQHGLVLFVKDIGIVPTPPGTFGKWGKAVPIDENELGNGSPGSKSVIEVYAANIYKDSYGGSKDAQGNLLSAFYWDATDLMYDAIVQETIAHELFHGISVEHHRSAITDITCLQDPDYLILVTAYPGSFSGYDYWPNNVFWPQDAQMGAVRCVMRYHWREIFAAICGDLNQNGFPFDAGEAPNEDWSVTLKLSSFPYLCTGNAILDGPVIGLPPGNNVALVNDNCLSKVDVSDAP